MFIEANGMEILLFIYFLYLLDLKKEEIGIFSSRSILYGLRFVFVGFYIMRNLRVMAIYISLNKKVYLDLLLELKIIEIS